MIDDYKNKHTSSDYSLFVHCLFDATKTSMIFKAKIVWKHLQRSKKTCNKKSKLWKKEMIQLTTEENQS